VDALQPVAKPIIGLTLTSAVLLYTWNWPGSRRSDMPPGKFAFNSQNYNYLPLRYCHTTLSGPRPLPILGNLLSLKPTDVYEQ
jgi:hypothetical protein